MIQCPCAANLPVYGNGFASVPTVGATVRSSATAATSLAALATNPVTSGTTLAQRNAAFARGYTPAVQIQYFEPAVYTPCPVFTVLPYSPALVSAVTPVSGPTVSLAAQPQPQTSTPSPTPTSTPAQPQTSTPAPTPTQARMPLYMPGINSTDCGCCSNVYSPLPPNSVSAWSHLLEQNSRPYAQLLPGCGGLSYF